MDWRLAISADGSIRYMDWNGTLTGWNSVVCTEQDQMSLAGIETIAIHVLSQMFPKT